MDLPFCKRKIDTGGLILRPVGAAVLLQQSRWLNAVSYPYWGWPGSRPEVFTVTWQSGKPPCNHILAIHPVNESSVYNPSFYRKELQIVLLRFSYCYGVFRLDRAWRPKLLAPLCFFQKTGVNCLDPDYFGLVPTTWRAFYCYFFLSFPISSSIK